MSEKLHPLVEVAALIALETPAKPNKYSRDAYVSWKLILELRGVLAAMGYDTDAMRAGDKLTRATITKMLQAGGAK